MTRRQPRVPGLSDEWATQQLTLDELMAAGHPCASCTTTMSLEAQVAAVEWQCDPDRPGCPLHTVPELSRERTEPNDGPGPDGHHRITGECFACLVGVATGPESHGDRCPMAVTR